jgi:hypothetical protein
MILSSRPASVHRPRSASSAANSIASLAHEWLVWLPAWRLENSCRSLGSHRNRPRVGRWPCGPVLLLTLHVAHLAAFQIVHNRNRWREVGPRAGATWSRQLPGWSLHTPNRTRPRVRPTVWCTLGIVACAVSPTQPIMISEGQYPFFTVLRRSIQHIPYLVYAKCVSRCILHEVTHNASMPSHECLEMHNMVRMPSSDMVGEKKNY